MRIESIQTNFPKTAFGINNKNKPFINHEVKQTENYLPNFPSYLKDVSFFGKKNSYKNSCPYFINPKTGNSDPKLKELKERLDKKYKKAGNYFPKQEVWDILPIFINKNTGEIEEKCVNFIEKYYLKPLYKTREGSFLESLREFIPKYENIKLIDNYYPSMAGTLNLLRDKKGNYSKENELCLKKVFESQDGYSFIPASADGFPLNMIRNKEGIIDKEKFDCLEKRLGDFYGSSGAKNYIDVINSLGAKKADFFYQTCKDLYEDEKAISRDIKFYRNFVFDFKGNEIKGRMKKLKELAPFFESGNWCEALFPILFDKKSTDLLCGLYGGERKLSMEDVFSLKRCIKGNTTDDFYTDKLKRAVQDGNSVANSIDLADYIYKNSSIKPEQKDDFFRGISLITGSGNNELKRQSENAAKILSGENNFSNVDYSIKKEIVNSFYRISSDKNKNALDIMFPIIKKLEANLAYRNFVIEKDENSTNNFKRTVLNSKKETAEGFSTFDSVIKNSKDDFLNMQNGLKLKYSREEFLKDLNEFFKDKSPEIKEAAAQKLNVLFEDENGEIKDYNGLINLQHLNGKNKFEETPDDIINKFFLENEVQTGNLELDEQLNRLIDGAPEFINIIGKKDENGNPLDIKQLLILQAVLSDREYEKLKPADRAIVKMSALFSQLSSIKGLNSDEKDFLSGFYSKEISRKFIKNKKALSRINHLCANYKKLNKPFNNEKELQKIAFEFRYPNDFEMAKILLRADKNTKINPDKKVLNSIQNYLNYLYSTGCAVFSDYPTLKKDDKRFDVIYKGKKYRVIDFNNINENENMKNWGFRPDVTKNELYFLVHMVPQSYFTDEYENLKTVLGSPDEGVLSESLITPKYQTTLMNRKYGFLLSHSNLDIVNTKDSDLHSGNKKDKDVATEQIFGDENQDRKNYKKALLEKLKISKDIPDTEFAKFYKTNIASKTSIAKINPNKEFELCGKTFSGEELKEAILEYQNSLIDKNGLKHNEIIGCAPEIKALIAKAKTMDELPNNFLDFAYKNNLIIILI